MVVHVLGPERARLKTGNRGAEGGRTGPRAKAARGVYAGGNGRRESGPPEAPGVLPAR